MYSFGNQVVVSSTRTRSCLCGENYEYGTHVCLLSAYNIQQNLQLTLHKHYIKLASQFKKASTKNRTRTLRIQAKSIFSAPNLRDSNNKSLSSIIYYFCKQQHQRFMKSLKKTRVSSFNTDIDKVSTQR